FGICLPRQAVHAQIMQWPPGAIHFPAGIARYTGGRRLIAAATGPISHVMMMQRDRQFGIPASARAVAPGWSLTPGRAGVAAVYGQATGGATHEQGGTGVVTEKARPKTRQPPLYRVVLHNDDYTPMEFVVEVLLHYFSVSHDEAVQIMLTVHTRGKGVAG